MSNLKNNNRNNEEQMILALLPDMPIAFNRDFVKLGIGITGALMLSQSIYWYKRATDPDGFYKTYEEWKEETGMTQKEFRNAREKLKKKGYLIITNKWVPCRSFYKLNVKKIYYDLMQVVDSSQFAPKGQTRCAERDKLDVPKGTNSIKETTKEITKDNTSPNPSKPMVKNDHTPMVKNDRTYTKTTSNKDNTSPNPSNEKKTQLSENPQMDTTENNPPLTPQGEVSANAKTRPRNFFDKKFRDELIESFNQLVSESTTGRRCIKWTRSRDRYLRARMKEHEKHQDIEWWKHKYFGMIANSHFLMHGMDRTKLTMDWILRPENFTKIVEGTYDDQ